MAVDTIKGCRNLVRNRVDILTSTNSIGCDNLLQMLPAANCGPPSLPTNGYVDSHTGTEEGARVDVTCLSESQQQENYTVLIICSQSGRWQPNPTDICNQDSGMYYSYHIHAYINDIGMISFTTAYFICCCSRKCFF